jgi:hypothetical protein
VNGPLNADRSAVSCLQRPEASARSYCNVVLLASNTGRKKVAVRFRPGQPAAILLHLRCLERRLKGPQTRCSTGAPGTSDRRRMASARTSASGPSWSSVPAATRSSRSNRPGDRCAARRAPWSAYGTARRRPGYSCRSLRQSSRKPVSCRHAEAFSQRRSGGTANGGVAWHRQLLGLILPPPPWKGTSGEWRQLVAAVGGNCSCPSTVAQSGVCLAHRMLADPSSFNRLLFGRRMAHRLEREEFSESCLTSASAHAV